MTTLKPCLLEPIKKKTINSLHQLHSLSKMRHFNRPNLKIVTALLTLLFVSPLYTTEATTGESESESTLKDFSESGGEGREIATICNRTFQMGGLTEDACLDEELSVREVSKTIEEERFENLSLITS